MGRVRKRRRAARLRCRSNAVLETRSGNASRRIEFVDAERAQRVDGRSATISVTVDLLQV
jgi:hypothetical protein